MNCIFCKNLTRKYSWFPEENRLFCDTCECLYIDIWNNKPYKAIFIDKHNSKNDLGFYIHNNQIIIDYHYLINNLENYPNIIIDIRNFCSKQNIFDEFNRKIKIINIL